MKRIAAIGLTLTFAGLVGCGGVLEARVNFSAQPGGATLSCGSKEFGDLPQNLYWQLPFLREKNGYIGPWTATWPDGTQRTHKVRLYRNDMGSFLDNYTVEFIKPEATPDDEYAAQPEVGDGPAPGGVVELQEVTEE